jgi:hypothetical protein
MQLFDANLMNSSNAIVDIVIGTLCRLLSTIFNSLYQSYSSINDKTDDYLLFIQTVHEVIRYLVLNINVMHKLSLM